MNVPDPLGKTLADRSGAKLTRSDVPAQLLGKTFLERAGVVEVGSKRQPRSKRQAIGRTFADRAAAKTEAGAVSEEPKPRPRRGRPKKAAQDTEESSEG